MIEIPYLGYMVYIDFHTHQAPSSNDIKAIINPSSGEDTSFISSHYLSYGIHPWYINNYEDQLIKLESLLKTQKALTIGECGLDKINGPDLPLQEMIFRAHITLSEKYKRPLVIHCVRAYSEIIKLRKDLKPELPWIFHGFNSSETSMRQALLAGFHFSFGAALLQPGPKVQTVFINTPTDRLFLETDDSGLDIKHIYTKAASLKSMSLNELGKRIERNFKSLFHMKTI